MYPIRFENLYYDKIWGGRDLEEFRTNLPQGDIGESWDIACHPNGTGIVANGELKGKSFTEIIEEFGHSLVGTKVSTEKFPLLVKLINSREKLSVQVHPGDEYAKRVENEFGKTEAWYVVAAKPGAKLIVGTKNCDKAVFAKAIEEGKCEDYLNVIDVKKGDCFLINSGLVHAICEGLIIAEIQQNSDVTYRVYDYDRLQNGRPRELHIEKSIDVITVPAKSVEDSVTSALGLPENRLNELYACGYYQIYKLDVNGTCSFAQNHPFLLMSVLEGSGIVNGQPVKKGDHFILPCGFGEVEMQGEMSLVVSTVPA